MLAPPKDHMISHVAYHVTQSQITRKMPDLSQKSPMSGIQCKLHLNADARTGDQQPGIRAGFKAKIQNYQPWWQPSYRAIIRSLVLFRKHLRGQIESYGDRQLFLNREATAVITPGT